MQPTVPRHSPVRKNLAKTVVVYSVPVVVLLVVLLIFFKPSGNRATTPAPHDTEAADGTEVATLAPAENQKAFHTEHRPAPHELTPDELRRKLEHEIAISGNPYHEPEYAITVDGLHPKTLRYVYWAQLVKTGEGMTDPATKELAKQLEVMLVEHQQKEFPRLRKRYTEITEKALSHNRIVVEVHGSRNDEIYFIAPAFKDNSYVNAFHIGVSGVLRQFRFQQVRYFTQPGTETYHYPTGSRPDAEIHESLE
jgi:hypothetical protein